MCVCGQCLSRARVCNQGRFVRRRHLLLSEPLWTLLWSAAFTGAPAAAADIIGVESARKDYASVMRRFFTPHKQATRASVEI